MAKSIAELEAELEDVKAKNAEALKAERKRARQREADVRAAIARAQAKTDETWGRRLREAGATDQTVDYLVERMKRQAAKQQVEAAGSVTEAVSADGAEQ